MPGGFRDPGSRPTLSWRRAAIPEFMNKMTRPAGGCGGQRAPGPAEGAGLTRQEG